MNSNARVADLLAKLMAGQTVGFDAGAGVSLRTFQRDLAAIRTALAAQNAGRLVETKSHQFQLVQGDEVENLALITGISSVLLGSRALSASEMIKALRFLQARLTPEDTATVNFWLKQEKEDYVPLVHTKPLLALMTRLETAIAAKLQVTFTYRHSGQPQCSEIKGQPVTIYFDRFYFYVVMFVEKKHRYQLFRLDRIHEIIQTAKGQPLPHGERYFLSEHRRHSYLLDMGEFMAFRYECYNSPDNALDIFPDSRVIRRTATGGTIIESYAFVFGAMLWLRSQGDLVRVISPPSLVNRMRESLTAALKRYDEGGQ